VRGTQARSRLLLVRVVFGVRGAGRGRCADGQMESCVWTVITLPTYKIRGTGPWYENTGLENSSLIVRSVKGVSAFPFLNGRVFQPPQNRTNTDKYIRSSVYISYDLGFIRQ
jgi:hypothetical protein